MKKETVQSLFQLANIEVLGMWELMNQYWPRSYHELVIENPWWLVKTKAGLIEIGNRKRVMSISWEDTNIRKVLTSDDTTKSETYIHAWTDEKALEYLKTLGVEISALDKEKTCE
jgi:hypothetical protein